MVNKTNSKKLLNTKQIQKFKEALKNIEANIQKKIDCKDRLDIKTLTKIIEDNEILWIWNYENILDFVINTWHFKNKNKVIDYFNEYFIHILTTFKKNIIIKEFKKRLEKGSNKNDLIDSMLFIMLFFRNKKKNWKQESVFWNIQKELEKNINENNQDKLKQKVKEEFNKYYDKTNFQADSIFSNQLIKYINWKMKSSAKQNETNLVEEDFDVISFFNIKNKGIPTTHIKLFENIKEEIMEQIFQTNYKEKLKDVKFVSREIRRIGAEVWKLHKINVKDQVYIAYLNEIIENVQELFLRRGKYS